MKQAIIDGPIADVNQKLLSLGHGSESSPSPPVSKADRYKPSGSTKTAQLPPPMKTRARDLEGIPGLE